MGDLVKISVGTLVAFILHARYSIGQVARPLAIDGYDEETGRNIFYGTSYFDCHDMSPNPNECLSILKNSNVSCAASVAFVCRGTCRVCEPCLDLAPGCTPAACWSGVQALNCRKTCRLCVPELDKDKYCFDVETAPSSYPAFPGETGCEGWRRTGWCEAAKNKTIPNYFSEHCKKSCGFC